MHVRVVVADREDFLLLFSAEVHRHAGVGVTVVVNGAALRVRVGGRGGVEAWPWVGVAGRSAMDRVSGARDR